MKEALIHIGMHKTGTTSIQESLKSYDDGHTFYADLEFTNHSIPMYTIFSENRFKYHIWTKQGMSEAEIRQKKNDFLNSLQHQLTLESRRRILISGEGISLLTPHEKDLMVRFFKNSASKVKILCVTRSPEEYAISILQERIKGGDLKHVPTINPQYQKKFNLS